MQEPDRRHRLEGMIIETTKDNLHSNEKAQPWHPALFPSLLITSSAKVYGTPHKFEEPMCLNVVVQPPQHLWIPSRTYIMTRTTLVALVTIYIPPPGRHMSTI